MDQKAQLLLLTSAVARITLLRSWSRRYLLCRGISGALYLHISSPPPPVPASGATSCGLNLHVSSSLCGVGPEQLRLTPDFVGVDEEGEGVQGGVEYHPPHVRTCCPAITDGMWWWVWRILFCIVQEYAMRGSCTTVPPAVLLHISTDACYCLYFLL